MTLTHQLNIEAGGEITGQYIIVIAETWSWCCGGIRAKCEIDMDIGDGTC